MPTVEYYKCKYEDCDCYKMTCGCATRKEEGVRICQMCPEFELVKADLQKDFIPIDVEWVPLNADNDGVRFTLYILVPGTLEKPESIDTITGIWNDDMEYLVCGGAFVDTSTLPIVGWRYANND